MKVVKIELARVLCMSLRIVCVISAFAMVVTSGCVSVRSSHGYVLERGEQELTAKEGIDTKESVLARYGEPSIIGTFNRDAWYYLAARDQSRAFFKPEVTSREIVAFHFNPEGQVAKVEKFDIEDGVDVKKISRATPARGKELGFWEQLLGTVGQLPAGGVGGQGGGGPR